MKKLVSILLLLALCLLAFAGCGKSDDTDQTPDDNKPNEQTPNSEDTTVARIGYFTGTTGIGMAKMIHDADSAYTFTKFNNPAEITAKLASGEIDIAAYPTNQVPELNNAVEGGVQYLAVNTLGVLYLCTNGVTVTSLSDLAGKTVYVPEQAPKLVLEYILKKNNMNDVEIKMSSLDLLPNQIVSGENGVQIALLPEPRVTTTKISANSQGNTSFAVSPLDLNAEWNKVSDTPITQGCLVVRTAFATNHAGVVNKFLSAYEASINYVKDPVHIGTAAQWVVDAGIIPKLPVAKQAVPNSNITYMAGATMKNAVLGFLEAFDKTFADTGFYNPTK